jgi:hypothetical protein
VLERTPPELASDVIDHGVVLTGGGARLRHLDSLLMHEVGVPVHVADEPDRCVARGASVALDYLDVIARARDAFDLPIAAYNVSGEYAMLKAAAANGWLDEQAAMLETLTSIKRAGADIVITYFAKDAARLLARG